jgi:hypothetical protein
MAAIASIDIVARDVEAVATEAKLPEADIATAKAVVASECGAQGDGVVVWVTYGGGCRMEEGDVEAVATEATLPEADIVTVKAVVASECGA